MAVCSVSKCQGVHHARGLCKRHYDRWRLTGMMARPTSPNPANPWAGKLTCPRCSSTLWTMPLDPKHLPGVWRCVDCHITLKVAA